jgi:protein-ribulosamine 3-kinase
MYNIARHRMDRAHIREYQRHIPPSAPEEDFDDRIILYRIRVNMASSMAYLDDVRLREL